VTQNVASLKKNKQHQTTYFEKKQKTLFPQGPPFWKVFWLATPHDDSDSGQAPLRFCFLQPLVVLDRKPGVLIFLAKNIQKGVDG